MSLDTTTIRSCTSSYPRKCNQRLWWRVVQTKVVVVTLILLEARRAVDGEVWMRCEAAQAAG